MRLRSGKLLLALYLGPAAGAQVIEFESGGLHYQTLTRGGITVMFAPMQAQVRNFSAIQVAVSNGSSKLCMIRPEDFRIEYEDKVVRAVPALAVITELIRAASGKDVIRLVTAYEATLYGYNRIRSTNGYEKRRQAALAYVSSPRLKAAAAASAIALVQTVLNPGESTDGAVFYPVLPRGVKSFRVRAEVAGYEFEFNPVPANAVNSKK